MSKFLNKKAFTNNNKKYTPLYVKMTPKQVNESFKKYNNEALKIDIVDFTGKDTYYNSHLRLKCPDTAEYVIFKISFANAQMKKRIREASERYYSTDISVLLRLHDCDDDTEINDENINEFVLALKNVADAYVKIIQSLIDDGYIWKSKDKKIKKKDNGITVDDTAISTYMQLEDRDGKPIKNSIAYVGFGNKNKLKREPQPPLTDEDGNIVRYQGKGNPEVQIYNLNVNFIQIYKNSAKVVSDPKYKNPITGRSEHYNNINIQHLITYNSLLSGCIKFQIIASAKGIKLSAFFDGTLYVLRNNKKSSKENVDLSIVHQMQNSTKANKIEDSDEEKEDANSEDEEEDSDGVEYEDDE